MSKDTFKMLRSKVIVDPLEPSKTITVRRWKTLIDRPAHNVKKGQLTGLIDVNIIPDGDEEAWFGYDTLMYGSVHTGERVGFYGKAIVRGPAINGNSKLRIFGDVVIGDNAIVGIGSYDEKIKSYRIEGHAKIIDNAVIGLPKIITGNVVIRDHSRVGQMAEIDGDVEIYDQATIGDSVSLQGHIHVHDNSIIGNKASILGELNADRDSKVLPEARIRNGIVESAGVIYPVKKILDDLPKVKNLSFMESIPTLEKVEKLAPAQIQSLQAASKIQSPHDFWMDKINTIKANINAYETDIVKIIKFPVMVDLTDIHTADMVFALTDVEVALNTDGQDFIQAATQLERKFLIAESNARKIAGTKFTEDELKKTQQARDLFSLACHETTSEHEKRKAFKQGFSRLEGIIAIPDQAIEAMRVKVGIAEIEM